MLQSATVAPCAAQTHDAAKAAIKSALRRAGAWADEAEHLPELYTPDQEAFMDLVPGRARQTRSDTASRKQRTRRPSMNEARPALQQVWRGRQECSSSWGATASL